MISGSFAFDNAINCGFRLNPMSTGPGTVSPKYRQYLVPKSKCPPNDVTFTLVANNAGTYAESIDYITWIDDNSLDYTLKTIPLYLPHTTPSYVHKIENSEPLLQNMDVYCVFSFRNPQGVYGKINWVSSGRYLSVTVDGKQYVHDMGSNSSSYGVAGFSGYPNGYYNSPPSPPYRVFPSYSANVQYPRFRVPYGRVTSGGSLRYGYLYLEIKESSLVLVDSASYSGSSDPTYAQEMIQVTPAGLYKKGIGLGPYGPDLNNWLH